MPALLKTSAIFLLILAVFAGIAWLGMRVLSRTPAKATALPVRSQAPEAATAPTGAPPP